MHHDSLYLNDASVTLLSEWLRQHEPDLVAAALQRVRQETSVFSAADGSVLDQGLVESITEHVRRVTVGLGRGRELPTVPPSAALELARELARRGVSVDELLKAYRIVHRELWHVSVSHARATLDPDKIVAAMLVTSRYFFASTHAAARDLIEAYEHERVDRARTSQRRESQLVRDVLSGLPIDRFSVAYGFDRRHVGIVAAGDGVEATIRRIADANGADVLTTRGPAGVVWGWLGFAREAIPASADLFAGVPSADAARIGVGENAKGVAGFRQTHRQAARAFEVAERYALPCASYRDVSLIALISAEDREASDEFVRRELGLLLESGRRAAGLRATLDAYFATGQKSSAARLLGLGDRTIAYRLDSVEAALGRDIDSRRLELSAALRLARMQGLIDREVGAS